MRRQRWRGLFGIEKYDIGAINARMDTLRLQQRALDQSHDIPAGVAGGRHEIQQAMATLQAQYEVLAQEARTLRAQQEEDAFATACRPEMNGACQWDRWCITIFLISSPCWSGLGLLARNTWVFLTQEPREANTEGGVFPAIFGTFVMTVLMSLAVTPFGVVAAYTCANMRNRALRSVPYVLP